MCDMQKMPTSDDASCDEEGDMNFAAFQAVGGGGTHFVTAGGQVPMAKIQQNVSGNAAHLQQVVGMVGSDGNVQYVRADGGMQSPHLISVPIALPGAKPGDPQQTVQIQVLSPGMLQQQQPKYQMQIPIQGFHQGGAVLTLAYAPENETGGLQLIGNSLPDGVQVVTAVPQEMQLVQPAQLQDKDQHHVQHQVFITPNQQIIINSIPDGKMANNNNINNNNNGFENVIIKEECEDSVMDDYFVMEDEDEIDETSQEAEGCEQLKFESEDQKEALMKYLNQLPQQNQQLLPVPLQQFLRLNPGRRAQAELEVEVEVSGPAASAADAPENSRPSPPKKKKKYKKKAERAARPKPGQVVIAQADDGSPIYCCPECQLAYPEKEQLEMHLIVHKIERRYICGICGAGLKRKEHLERHKLGHNPERPFVCSVCCKGFKRREHLALHAVIHSGLKTEVCLECGKGFYRKDHLRKHTRSHEHRRLKNEAQQQPPAPASAPAPATAHQEDEVLPEITIHVPTSANVNVPVQINIPQHVMSSLAAARAQQVANANASANNNANTNANASHDAHETLDALLS